MSKIKKKSLLFLLLSFILVLCAGCIPVTPPAPENNAPSITSTPVTVASVDSPYSYNVEATDEDDDTLIYVLTSKPEGMVISFSSGTITWIPDTEGTFDVVVEVSDGQASDTQSFVIDVQMGTVEPPPPTPPPAATKRVVMWEFFVGPVCSRCEGVSSAVAKLRNEYGYDELILLEEFGWDYEQYTGWEVQDVKSRYYDYRSVSGTEYGGFPAAYFNGVNQFVYYGDRGYDNYKAAIEAELAKPVKATLSASYEIVGSTVNISGTLLNSSDGNLSNMVIEAMVYENSVYSEKWKKNVDYVVRDIITYEESDEIVSSLLSGESVTFDLTSANLSNVHNMNNIHVVVYVQTPNSSTKEILQALHLE